MKKAASYKKDIFLYPLLAMFLGILLIVFVFMYPILKDKTREYLEGQTTATEITDKLEKEYADKFVFKNSFVNLNGLMARILGQNYLNIVIKLNNGHLSHTEDIANDAVIRNAAEMATLNNFLAERGIGFLYIPVPNKNTFYIDEFPDGYINGMRINREHMLKLMQEYGVKTFDLNAWFKAQSYTMDEVYFKTDDHWRPEVALPAAAAIMKFMVEEYGIQMDATLLDPKNYTVDIYKNFFLGNSYGKRVGTLYAGVDDFSLFRPSYENQITFGLPKYNILETGSIDETMLHTDYLKKRNLFGANPYDTYIGGQYPLAYYQNKTAVNQMKVLLLGDSFGNMMEYFLSPQFSDVYSIDLRHYTSTSLAQYIDMVNPDLVLMCQYSVSHTSLYTFGVEEYEEAKQGAKVLLQQYPQFEVKPSDFTHNGATLFDQLESGKTYTLSIDRTAVTDGFTNYIQLILYDYSEEKQLKEYYFFADSDEKQQWIFTVPEGQDISLLLYAGMIGKTQDIGIYLDNIQIYEGVYIE